jgi:flagellar assembly protein FliH
MKPLSSDATMSDATMRQPVVTSGAQADAARAVRFDRPLVEIAGWGDPRVARQVAEATLAGRRQGLAEGYAEGWAQGRRAADARAQEEHAERAEREASTRRQLTSRSQTLLANLAQAGRTLSEQAAPAWDELADVLVEGAVAIAAAAFGRELAAIDDETLEAVRAALRLLPAAEAIALHVHPSDVELLGRDGAGAATAAQPLPAGLRVVADPAVATGTVVARTCLHTLPVDLKACLRAAEEVLRS